MKDVDKSNYIVDKDLKKMTKERKRHHFSMKKIIADKKCCEELDLSDLYNIDVTNPNNSQPYIP